MNSVTECRILIVDDESELCKMIRDVLHREGFERVWVAANCEQARTAFSYGPPDGVILDVSLPDGDGFSLIRELRAISDVPVLFLTARTEDHDRLLGLGLGADDYITKPFLTRELLLRLRAVLARTYFPATLKRQTKAVFALDAVDVDLNTGMVTRGAEQASLTAKEYALLEALYTRREQIVTSDELCRAGWGEDAYGYENALMVHIRHLREKIEVDPSAPQHLLTVRGLGYRLVGATER